MVPNLTRLCNIANDYNPSHRSDPPTCRSISRLPLQPVVGLFSCGADSSHSRHPSPISSSLMDTPKTLKLPVPPPFIPDHNPVNNYLMLRVKRQEEKSKGGIIIPEQARDNPHEGEVIKIGPLVSGPYALGDIVVFTAHSNTRLKIDGHEINLVPEDSVILRIPKDKYVETSAPHTP